MTDNPYDSLIVGENNEISEKSKKNAKKKIYQIKEKFWND